MTTVSKNTKTRTSKHFKSQDNQKDAISRTANDAQVKIPDYIGDPHLRKTSYDDVRELNVWTPENCLPQNKLDEFLEHSKKYNYTEELATILLNWHEYDVDKALNDLPNYIPASNKWTKGEVRKFLKCIDSKPRKNFLEAKKSVPGRPMGDICALYYSIAAPFKARTGAKCRSDLIEQCFSRALQNGLIKNRWARSWTDNTGPHDHITSGRRPGTAEDSLERSFELHLVNVVGVSRATNLLGKELLSTPYPLLPNTDGPAVNRQFINSSSCILPARIHCGNNVSPTHSNGIHTYQTSSSETSSQVGSESVCQEKVNRYTLPNGIHYDHEEFLTFVTTPENELIREQELEVADRDRLNSEIMDHVREVENRARSVLHKMDSLKPADGFPEVSYRWTRTELALVLTAMSKYGSDFAAIAHTIGTKSESFIRDFYNQYRHRFPLDRIMNGTDSNPVAQPETIQISVPTAPSTPKISLDDNLNLHESTHCNSSSTSSPVEIKPDPSPSTEPTRQSMESDPYPSDLETPQKSDESSLSQTHLRSSSRRRCANMKFSPPEELGHKRRRETSADSSGPSSSMSNTPNRGRARGRVGRRGRRL